jgi:hypothetical protein
MPVTILRAIVYPEHKTVMLRSSNFGIPPHQLLVFLDSDSLIPVLSFRPDQTLVSDVIDRSFALAQKHIL